MNGRFIYLVCFIHDTYLKVGFLFSQFRTVTNTDHFQIQGSVTDEQHEEQSLHMAPLSVGSSCTHYKTTFLYFVVSQMKTKKHL